MSPCCVPCCKSNYHNSDKYISIFGFPKDEAMKEKWLKNINRKNFTPTKWSRVCINHFSEQHIIREDRGTRADGTVLVVKRTIAKLSDDAYPTIFHKEPNYKTTQPPKSRKTPELKMADRCCIKRCKTNHIHGPKVTLYSFPKNEEMRRKWADAVKENFVPTKYSKVCALHFKPSAFIQETFGYDSAGRKLIAKLHKPRIDYGAIPSLHLTSSNDLIIPSKTGRKSQNKTRQNRKESKKLKENQNGKSQSGKESQNGKENQNRKKARKKKSQRSPKGRSVKTPQKCEKDNSASSTETMETKRAAEPKEDTKEFQVVIKEEKVDEVFEDPTCQSEDDQKWDPEMVKMEIKTEEYLDLNVSVDGCGLDGCHPHLQNPNPNFSEDKKVDQNEISEAERTPSPGPSLHPRPSGEMENAFTSSNHQNQNNESESCVECHITSNKGCSRHPLLLVLIAKVPPEGMGELAEGSVVTLPIAPCPPRVKDEGRGLWTNVALPKGLIFGPFRINLTQDSTPPHATENDTPAQMVGSNCLPYINFCRSSIGANLATFQEGGQLYYKTITHIERGCELLISCDDEFALKLGFNVGREQEQKTPSVEGEDSESSLTKKLQSTIDGTTNGQERLSRYACVLLLKWDRETPPLGMSTSKMVVAHNTKNPPLGKKDKEITNKLVCSLCNKKFLRAINLENHLRVHNGEQPFKCSYCGRGFTKVYKLRYHIRTHTGEKTCKCTVCDKAFAHPSTLAAHRRIHTGEKPYKCPKCDKRFSKSCNRNCHVRTHFGKTGKNGKPGKTYECTVCEETFNHAISFGYHMMGAHNIGKTYDCTMCYKKLISADSLEKHLLNHSKEKSFECSQCFKKFICLTYLKTHMKTHSLEKPFKCDLCDKRFKESCSFKRHQRTHSGEKPYNCPICGKSFADASTRNHHVVIHTGEKPFECSVCHKTFSRSCGLKAHFRRHSDEKPFECTICSRKFKEASTLRKHHRIHSGEKPYGCPKCTEHFKFPSTRKNHLRRVHDN